MVIKRKVIGICSPFQGCGKSTLAKALKRNNPDAQVLPFAETLKAMVAVLLVHNGYTQEEAEILIRDHKNAKLDCLGGKTLRYVMQTLGTDWGRKLIDPDLWIHPFRHKAGKAIREGRDVISDDMRFPNELAAVEALGGDSVMVLRTDLQPPEEAGHASEENLDASQVDVTLEAGRLEARELEDYMNATAVALWRQSKE
jgi:hypothetical protein